MKKRLKIKTAMRSMAIIAIVAVIGLVVVTCDNGNTPTTDPCATGHNFGDDSDWVQDAEAATCTYPSHDTRDCKNAPCTVKDRRAGSHPALGHDLPGAYPATCMADGYTGIGTCKRCYENETGKTLKREPDNHDFSGTPVITPATCTVNGKEVVNCGNNGCTKTHTTVTDEPLGHEGSVAAFAATCTTAGNSVLSGNCVRFAQCNHVVTGTVLAALGHQIANWTTPLTSATVTQACDRTTCNDNVTLAEYIQAHAGTAADPVPLKVSIDLGAMGTAANGWTQLLAALNTGNKLVALDLSGSTRLGNSAFTTGSTSSTAAPGLTGLMQIVSIVLPSNTVTSIGNYAFINCTSLTSVTIPNSVTSIGNEAFRDCTGLTSITIPDSVTSIYGSAFYGCSGLTSVTIPNSVTSIGSTAFYGCTGLTSITIPNSVTSIGTTAFYGCTGLTSVTIENSVIGASMFSGCTGLTSITIPNSVTSIGSSAFNGCTGLTSITIPSSVTTIDSETFRNCTGLTGVIIGNGVTSIGSSAFRDCTSLTSVTIPNSVTSIGGYVFFGCTGLTSITIPDSVTSIGDYAFSFCSNLTSVTFQRADTTIANNDIFPNGASLRAIYPSQGAGTYIRTGSTWAKQ